MDKVSLLNTDDIDVIANTFFEKGKRAGYELAVAEMRPLSKKQAAAFLDVTERTITNMMNSGALPFHRLSGKPYFLRFEIIEQLKK